MLAIREGKVQDVQRRLPRVLARRHEHQADLALQRRGTHCSDTRPEMPFWQKQSCKASNTKKASDQQALEHCITSGLRAQATAMSHQGQI